MYAWPIMSRNKLVNVVNFNFNLVLWITLLPDLALTLGPRNPAMQRDNIIVGWDWCR